MPGLGRASGERDAWLALRELRHATCLLLVVLHAMRPETQSVFTLRSFLERARACREQLANSQIVVAQRLDTLPTPPGRGASAEFDSLTRMVRELSGNRTRPRGLHLRDGGHGGAGHGRAAGPPAAARRRLDSVHRYWAGVAEAEPGRPDAAALTSSPPTAASTGCAA